MQLDHSRGPSRQLRKHPNKDPGKLVETVNSLPPAVFFQRYLPVELLQSLIAKVSESHSQLQIHCEGAGALKGRRLDECFRLVEESSAEDYRHSEIKWSAAKKRKEMLLPDLRYVVLECDGFEGGERKVAGFVSFMVTYEDGHEVIYCYEIHLAKSWQGKGLGKNLMQLVEEAGRQIGVEKSMLTVFRSNARALKMYESLKYAEDQYSPGPRTLRNGTVKEPTYRILSKSLKAG